MSNLYDGTPDVDPDDSEPLTAEEFAAYLAGLPKSCPCVALDSPEAWAAWRRRHPQYADKPTEQDRRWWGEQGGSDEQDGPSDQDWDDYAAWSEWESKLEMMHDPRNVEV